MMQYGDAVAVAQTRAITNDHPVFIIEWKDGTFTVRNSPIEKVCTGICKTIAVVHPPIGEVIRT